MVMYQSAIIAIGKMKVVRDGIVQMVAHRQFIEKIKTWLSGKVLGMFFSFIDFCIFAL